jgi:hypothetical protein
MNYFGTEHCDWRGSAFNFGWGSDGLAGLWHAPEVPSY